MRLYSWISLSPTSNSERSRSPKAEAEQDLERHTRQIDTEEEASCAFA